MNNNMNNNKKEPQLKGKPKLEDINCNDNIS